MSPAIFLLFLALGAAFIAVWVDIRFPTLGPASLRACFVHAAVAFVALEIVTVVIKPVLSAPDSFAAKLVALFGVLFPALVYAFLALTWLMKPLASALQRR